MNNKRDEQHESKVDGWNTRKYFNFIRGVLRQGFSRYPNKFKALSRAKLGRGKYKCNSCKGIFKAKNVSVDHITPAGTLTDYAHLESFIRNLYCDLENLQVLCDACHKRKTLKDRGMSDMDILVSDFKKLKAKEQRETLIKMGLIDDIGSNQNQRIAQFKRLQNARAL